MASEDDAEIINIAVDGGERWSFSVEGYAAVLGSAAGNLVLAELGDRDEMEQDTNLGYGTGSRGPSTGLED